MSDSWKQFEAKSAALFGEGRCWANSGERLDFPPKADTDAPVVGQCKEVKVLSLNELTNLAEEVETEAIKHQINGGGSLPTIGVVCVKVRRGRGQPSQALVVMTFKVFEKLRDTFSIMDRIRERVAKKGTKK